VEPNGEQKRNQLAKVAKANKKLQYVNIFGGSELDSGFVSKTK
jgi:hypothetical protein